MLSLLLAQVFDKHTAFGVFALATLHLHIWYRGRRQARLEAVQGVLVKGHVAGIQAHRDLALELPKVTQ